MIPRAKVGAPRGQGMGQGGWVLSHNLSDTVIDSSSYDLQQICLVVLSLLLLKAFGTAS